MRKILWLALALSIAVFQVIGAADFSNLVVIHTNDTHGYDQKADGVYGMAAVAALKQEYEAKGKDVLLVDAGDAIQDHNLVNLSQGATAIAFMNAAGYDAMTLGNHEFDYGQDVTLERAAEADFPFLSCNILVDATGKPFVRPYTIVKKGGVTVGIIGITTPETAGATNPKHVYGLTFLDGQDLYDAVQSNVDYLRGAGCDLIVALGHVGSEPISEGHRSDDILRRVRGIDLFIDGHDHRVKNYRVDGVLLAATGSHLANIGVVSYADGQWQEQNLPYGAFAKEDEAVKALVDKAAADVQAELSRPIGTADIMLDGSRPKVRMEETNLGDFIADAVLWQARMATAAEGTSIDGAVVNGGGLRASIPAGVVTQGGIQSVLPYRNQVCVVTMTGQTLLEIMEAATAAAPYPAGAFPQVSGIEMTVRTDIPFAKGPAYGNGKYYKPAKPGQRVTIHSVGGRAFSPDAVYTIATYEFISRGGDAYSALAEAGRAETKYVGYTDAEAIVHYIQDELQGRIGTEYAAPQGRMQLRP
ncbi:bifunctional metallophosphatase/5'-nucleotidase [Megasphaera stantonii]|uniref:Bifunctional metallophosphatase/5'-nucleotidase n=1 Tax=Megasphaera stantonii TaxID=2144175 RepID=A0A346AZ97_9FIRM|nr:bifunctional UDP-sugar hydrolase/5'-nucleotidase [Megasphaera stantonii]AXL21190.1 bifunctional metallophosphatase/5'-nucleotidase [Megasphaera stantonii]